MQALPSPPQTRETPQNVKSSDPVASLDDFLSDLGLVTTPLTGEEKFVQRLLNGVNLENLTFRIRSKCQDFRDMRRNGILIQHKTFRKGVLGTFDLTVEEYIQFLVKDYLLCVYMALFDKKLAGDDLYLDINQTVMLVLKTDKIKQTIIICKDYDKGGKYE
jgi:hypothetical protein